MNEFKREERFIVIKRKHLSAESRVHDSLEQELRVWLDKHLIPTSECVVVESDWPEYETVWSMIAARVEGRPTPYQVIEQQVAALRQHKNDYMEAAEETRRALEAEAQALREELAEVRGRADGLADQTAALRARVVVPDEHAAFEDHYKSLGWKARHLKQKTDRPDVYDDWSIQPLWLAWQARARLNGKAVSDGLLLRIIHHLEWNGTEDQGITVMDYIRRGDSMAEELRILLGEGKEVGDVPSA